MLSTSFIGISICEILAAYVKSGETREACA